jgi:tRNA(fMet)-specific endonuclease VapC
VLLDSERDPAAVDDVIADDDDTAIAAVTVAELQVGASLAGGSRRTARQRSSSP